MKGDARDGRDAPALLTVLRIPVTAAALAAAACAAGAGCSACERAEIEVLHPATAARAPAFEGGHRPHVDRGGGVLAAPDRPAGEDALASRATLTASGCTSRATLGLVESALDLVGAHGRPRSFIDGLAHFEGDGEGPRVAVRLARSGGRADETWLLDRTWALRRMGCGAMLVWEGNLAPVLERLWLVLAARERP